MVMHDSRDSGNTRRHWWNDLPPAIRERFRNRIQEELFKLSSASDAVHSVCSSRSSTYLSKSQTSERRLFWDFLQLSGSLFLFFLIILLLLLGGVIFLFSGDQPQPWRF